VVALAPVSAQFPWIFTDKTPAKKFMKIWRDFEAEYLPFFSLVIKQMRISIHADTDKVS